MFQTVFLLPLLAAAPVDGQQTPRPDAAAPVAADDGAAIIVTAIRSLQPADRIATSVTVLDKAQIDRAQDLSVADLIARTPGVSLSRNGGYGTQTSLRIRGAESDQTVVVIDGVKLNDPSGTGGGYDFGNLLVGDAARIEVLRGPQSILWGSQAIGGVVNIVTPLPTAPLEGNFDVEGGARDTVSARAGVGGRTGPLAWRVGAQAFHTGGISAIAPAFGGREADGYRNQSASGRAVLDIAGGVSAEVRGYYSNGRTDIDGFSGDTPEYGLQRDFVGYAGLNIDLFDQRFRNRFAYGYTNTDRDNYNPALTTNQKTFAANGRNERLEYQGGFAIASGWDATFGVENEVSRFRSVSPPSGRAGITSVYGQLNAEVVKGLTVTGGVRNDDHSRFGSKTLFSGGGAWVLPTGTVIRGNYSEGFKAPSLYQLFSEYGNQALNPEQARGWEAGVEQRFLGGKASVAGTYFERRTVDQIDFLSCPFPADGVDPLCGVPGTASERSGYYANIARAFAKGVEAVARITPVEGLSIDGNYSWTAAVNRSAGSSNAGQWLARRPRHQANGSIAYTLPSGASAGVAVRHAGESFDDAANARRLAPCTLVDLRAELPVSAKVRLFARAENLFDRTYYTAYRYGTLGRSIYAGFRGRF